MQVSSSPIPYSFIPSESEQDNPNKLFLGGVSADVSTLCVSFPLFSLVFKHLIKETQAPLAPPCILQ